MHPYAVKVKRHKRDPPPFVPYYSWKELTKKCTFEKEISRLEYQTYLLKNILVNFLIGKYLLNAISLRVVSTVLILNNYKLRQGQG